MIRADAGKKELAGLLFRVETGVQLCPERFRISCRAGEESFHPERTGCLELQDLPLTLHHKAESNRLDPSCGQPGLDFSPQDRGNLVTHKAVQDTPRLLRHHQVHIDIPWILNGLQDGVFCDFMKGYAPYLFSRYLQSFLQMPCNGLAFTVLIRCKPHDRCFGSSFGEFFHKVFLVGRDDVIGGKPVFIINPDLFL